MVVAEAVTWATQLLTAVDWARIPRVPVLGGRDDWWQGPGGSELVLKGRAEVRALVQRRMALVVVGSGRCPPDWRVELGYPGLVAALVREASSAPCRVVGVWPQSGQIRVLPVDLSTLRATATTVVAAVATWVDGRIEAERSARGNEARWPVQGAPSTPEVIRCDRGRRVRGARRGRDCGGRSPPATT